MVSKDKSLGTCVAVVTTINDPNQAMNDLLAFAKKADSNVVIVGDSKTPKTWNQTDFNFLSLEVQTQEFPALAALTPTQHYSRKNLGYLKAKGLGATWIYETDDDNLPIEDPFRHRSLEIDASTFNTENDWLNIYEVFGFDSASRTPQKLWPRGFDLKSLSLGFTEDVSLLVNSPIQQGLANGDPDVDAIYRLVFGSIVTFKARKPITLQANQICPINSQTTWWHSSVFQLMYLPSTCTFRLTDIIRGFVAWRILSEFDMRITFHSPVVRQDRNHHDLIKDFKDEVQLFLGSDEIIRILKSLNLKSLTVSESLELCYRSLIEYGVVKSEELPILEKWNEQFE